MSRYYYDFHIHSCLSPCADNEMTPSSIAGIATLAGINIMALTDHNTVKNCPAFFTAAKAYGVIPIAGMELTTAEDIHIVCLFEKLEKALEFGDAVDKRRILIKNKVAIFGDQLIMDAEDNVIGTDEYLLSNATNITIDEVPDLVRAYDGVCFPAHIDRSANSVTAILGTFPELPYFGLAELHDSERAAECLENYPILKDRMLLYSSDAHYMWDIRDASAYVDIDDEPYSSDLVRSRLFDILRSKF